MPTIYVSDRVEEKLDELHTRMNDGSVGTVSKTAVIENALTHYEKDVVEVVEGDSDHWMQDDKDE